MEAGAGGSTPDAGGESGGLAAVGAPLRRRLPPHPGQAGTTGEPGDREQRGAGPGQLRESHGAELRRPPLRLGAGSLRRRRHLALRRSAGYGSRCLAEGVYFHLGT